jgi:polysaccharide export outer membrane protein
MTPFDGAGRARNRRAAFPRRTLIGAAVWLVALAGGPQTVAAQGARGDSAAGVAARASSAEPRPGDVVRLRIWREPDMSGEYPVNEDGDVVLPRVGTVHVVGMPADSLKRQLLATYAAYLRDPSIEITLLRRVSVTGAVRTPGVFTVDPTMTVGDVLALAGGPSPEGRRDRVDVLRAGATVSRDIARGARLGDTAVRSGDQLVVPERSWVSRNTGLVAGLASSAAFLIATIITNR